MLLCPVLICTLNLLNALWLHIDECGDLKGTMAFACYRALCLFHYKNGIFHFGASAIYYALYQSQYAPTILVTDFLVELVL